MIIYKNTYYERLSSVGTVTPNYADNVLALNRVLYLVERDWSYSISAREYIDSFYARLALIIPENMRGIDVWGTGPTYTTYLGGSGKSSVSSAEYNIYQIFTSEKKPLVDNELFEFSGRILTTLPIGTGQGSMYFRIMIDLIIYWDPIKSYNGKQELPRFIVEPQFGYVNNNSERGIAGQSYGLEQPKLKTVTVNWERLNQEEFDILKKYCEDYNTSVLHYIQLYPEAVDKYPDLLCTIDGDFTYTKRPEDGFYYDCSLSWLEAKS
jgi:hypothetical protein